ncbi:uncharacterized protein LOC116304144 [Actinia tenebrosa]|uniref:Uncharacterized protein LOC116304144 n=1 Tax=Actinia tenebrosa TaxID=6105 RepID=A0A6P8IRA8_ACTTE|nr:uncharacterized protein LOC116304144 [Actinia tenebrosa]
MESSNYEDQLMNISAFIKTSQERYEREKKEREDRFRTLHQKRQSILVDRSVILSRLNSTVKKVRDKIPLYETKVRVVRDENAVRRRIRAQPYRGELGIGSYEAWQLEDFYFIRDFVQSWIDEILDYVVCQPFTSNRDGFTESVNEMQEQLELEQSEMCYASAMQATQEDILNEVCKDLAGEAVSVSLAIHYQAQQTVGNMILKGILPTEGQIEENMESLLSYTYIQMKKDRNKQHKVWHHTQNLVYVSDEGTEIPESEEDAFDGNVLSLEEIVPYNKIPDHKFSENFLTYRDSELQFWSGFSDPIFSILPLPKRYKGIYCTALSSDHSLLAVAAAQGDLAVWDLSIYPPRVLKGCRGKFTVISMEWSLDSTQILTLDKLGTIQIWSMLNANSSIFDVKGFEPVEENLGFKTTELKSIISLEPQDLLFTEGNLVSMNEHVVKPTTVAFHPTFSFLGRQESIMVGLADGNILKLNLGRSSVGQGVQNKVGEGINAELFQAHKHPIQLISFVNNDSPMITFDAQAYIHLWEKKDESLSGFGWHTPIASFRLDSTEKTYEPVEGSTEKVEFVDTVKGTGKIKELNRSDMIEKRKETQTFINSLYLGRPWKTKDVGENKINHLYSPRNVPESGATFHSVTYYKDTKLLSRYTTLLYRPIRVDCTKILSCEMNFSGNKLVVALLFGDVPPKTPHVRFVTLEIPAMKVSPNVIEVALTEDEYRECKEIGSCGFDLTKVIDATGSEYIVTNVCGTIGGFSMTTGNLIMASGERDWTGCDLGKNQAIFSTARVKVASQASVLCALFYAPKQNMAILLHLRDKNTKIVRQQVWQDWQRLKGAKEIPVQQTWQKKQWTFDGEFAFHLEYTMESLVLELADAAVWESEGIEHKIKSGSQGLKNRVLPFVRHLPSGGNDSD